MGAQGCAELSEELSVLCSINTNVKLFCEIYNPKVEVAFQFFNDVLKKQDIIDSKIKTIEKSLSTTASDLTSQLDDLSKQLKKQSIYKKEKYLTPSQNQARNIAIPPTHYKAYSGDRRYNVVIFGITENCGTPRASRTKEDMKDSTTYQ